MGHFHHKMDEIQLSVIISSNNGCFSMGHYHPYLESDYTWATPMLELLSSNTTGLICIGCLTAGLGTGEAEGLGAGLK